MAVGQGRHTALRSPLTSAQWEVLRLTQRCRSATCTPQLRQRAWMVLALAHGQTITAIAQQAQVARKVVYKWVKRWQAEGLKGLRDRPAGYPRGRARRAP